MNFKTRADELLASARDVLTEQPSTFTVKPWREIMATKNGAKEAQAKEVKAAAKKVAAKTPPYKHELKAGAGAGGPEGQERREGEEDNEVGIDSTPTGAVQSGFSAFNPTSHQGANDTDKTTEAKAGDAALSPQGTAVPQATLDKEAATKAKIAAKENKQAEQKAAKEAAEKAKAEAKARRDAAKAENEKARAARAAELAASGRTYTGSMVALADRVKQGLYVKSATGQLRSTDELALAMDAVEPANTVKLGMLVFAEANKYAALNIGQQSMNYRNRLRGALKKGTYEVILPATTEGGEPVKAKLTIDLLKQLIVDHKLAIDVAAITAAKEAKAKEAAAKKEAAEKAKAAAAEAAKKAADEKIAAASKAATSAPAAAPAEKAARPAA